MNLMEAYYDPLHGPLELSKLEQDLLNLPDLQRLRWVSHLTFVYITFPSAKHSRYEHTLGTLGLLKRALRYLNLSKTEELTLRLAVVLHDLGQGPFCQAYNDLLERLGGQSQPLKRTSDLLRNKRDIYVQLFERHEKELADAGVSGQNLFDNIIEVLERRPAQIAKLLFGGVGLDRIDYYMRDARYTGVSPGRIDIVYLLKDLERRPQSPFLVFSADALASIEAILMRRGLLYYLVYSNPLDRSVQSTIVRILEDYCQKDLNRAMACLQWTDGQMWSAIRNTSTKGAAIYDGKLPKVAMLVRKSDKTYSALFQKLENLENNDGLRQIEEELQNELSVEPGDVVLDYDAPLVERDIADIAVRDGSRVTNLDSTDVAKACKSIEDRLVLCGLYCNQDVDESKVSSTFIKLIGL